MVLGQPSTCFQVLSRRKKSLPRAWSKRILALLHCCANTVAYDKHETAVFVSVICNKMSSPFSPGCAVTDDVLIMGGENRSDAFNTVFQYDVTVRLVSPSPYQLVKPRLFITERPLDSVVAHAEEANIFRCRRDRQSCICGWRPQL